MSARTNVVLTIPYCVALSWYWPTVPTTTREVASCQLNVTPFLAVTSDLWGEWNTISLPKAFLRTKTPQPAFSHISESAALISECFFRDRRRSLSNKTDLEGERTAWTRFRVSAACLMGSPWKSNTLFFGWVYASPPSPFVSWDVIKRKNRMKSLPHLLHSAGLIIRGNKLGEKIQLS